MPNEYEDDGFIVGDSDEENTLGLKPRAKGNEWNAEEANVCSTCNKSFRE